jgi:hypothetical protein
MHVTLCHRHKLGKDVTAFWCCVDADVADGPTGSRSLFRLCSPSERKVSQHEHEFDVEWVEGTSGLSSADSSNDQR